MSEASETPTTTTPPPEPQQPPAGRKFPCRQCGARLDFDPAARGLKCPYCGFLEKIEPKSDSVTENSWDDYWSKQHKGEDATLVGHATEVRCTGCGAVVLFDDKVATDSCPYCSTHLENKPERARAMIKPEAVLPFLVAKSQAVDHFGKWIESRWFAPGTLRKFALLGRLSGMYVPYWTYDSMTYTYYEGQRGDDYTETKTYTETNAQGQQETKTRTVTKTRWTWVSGEVDHFFDDVLVCASRSLPDSLVTQLEPWDLDKLENYKDEYLSGFVTERYAVDLKEGFDHAQEIMDTQIRAMCCRDIGGDHQRLSSVQTQHVGVTFKHVLMPVWVAPYRYLDKPYQILVNARTGEVVGSRPYSWIKIAALVLFIIAVIVTIFVIAQGARGAAPSLPRSAWERSTPPLRGESLASTCGTADRDAERRGGAFPRRAWERGEENSNEAIHNQAGAGPDGGRHRVAGRRSRLPARVAA